MSKHGPVCQPQERRDSRMDWLPEYLSFVSYLDSAETIHEATTKVPKDLRSNHGDFWLLQLQSWECPTSYAMRQYPHSYIAHPSEAACRTRGHFERNGFLTFPLSVHNIQHVFIEIPVYIMNPKISFFLWVEWYCWCPKSCNSRVC